MISATIVIPGICDITAQSNEKKTDSIYDWKAIRGLYSFLRADATISPKSVESPHMTGISIRS